MSFSSEIKEHLKKDEIKNKCCAEAELFCAMLFYCEKNIVLNDAVLKSRLIYLFRKSCFDIPKEKEECKNGRQVFCLDTSESFRKLSEKGILPSKECCRKSFLKMAFILTGTVNSPESRYTRLEFNCPNENFRNFTAESLNYFSIEPLFTIRNAKFVVYVTKNEAVSDILTLVGASRERLLFDSKAVEREVNNNVNRVMNCDSKNLNLSLSVSEKQIEDIEILKKYGVFDSLSDELRTTAELRLKNPELSISDLAEIHRPSITRSGLNHRFSKISALASKYRK